MARTLLAPTRMQMLNGCCSRARSPAHGVSDEARRFTGILQRIAPLPTLPRVSHLGNLSRLGMRQQSAWVTSRLETDLPDPSRVPGSCKTGVSTRVGRITRGDSGYYSHLYPCTRSVRDRHETRVRRSRLCPCTRSCPCSSRVVGPLLPLNSSVRPRRK